ncbi:hypothetical protein HELRODRAFT_162063 [Helobdella robusta]|uniref:AB hydrolase-1 domain-containing protein n=1 Tax=Helobdella robusta TaxID=6412 RepID=T1ES76_HELRO|nr:hypothetical protein HELRODRAFT_162063 [Helobdella robusta]ESN98626.1 hypothetical protein HELRODRAFT_162063 [Helobdella robusta]
MKLRTSDNLAWPILQTYMTTCQELWSGRPAGATFYVGFIDTGPPKDIKNAKNVLFLLNEHSIDDDNVLESLQNNVFMPLHNENCRVFMPCLVGSKYTEGVSPADDNFFDYQLLGERSRFVLDFLANRRIKMVDMIVGHSMACFSALTLASNCESFQRLALISPLPGFKPPSWIQPLKRSIMMINSYNHLLLWPLGRLLIERSRRKMKGLMGDHSTKEQILHMAKVSHGINFNVMGNIVTSLAFRKIPFLSISSRNDVLVDKGDLDKYLETLGVYNDNTVKYDQTLSSFPSSLASQSLSRGVQLESATHYPFLDNDFSKIIVAELLNLLKNPT